MNKAFFITVMTLLTILTSTVSAATAAKTESLASLIRPGMQRLELPEGTFLLGPQTLKLPKNFVLTGQGKNTVIDIAPGTEKALDIGEGCRISNLFIRADRAKFDPATPALLLYARGDGIIIENLTIHDSPRTAITADHATNSVIRNNTIVNSTTAISLVFSDDVEISGNTVRNAKVHGIQFWGNENDFSRMASQNIKITGNTVVDGGNGAIWGTGARGVIMANNVIDGAEDVGLDLEWCMDSVIVGNTVRRAKNAGIALFLSCENVAITGNSILNDHPITEKDKKESYWVRSGIWLTTENTKLFPGDKGHRNIVITGNSITCAAGERRAIWIAGHHIVMQGNALRSGSIWAFGEHNIPLKNLGTADQIFNSDTMPTVPASKLGHKFVYPGNLLHNPEFEEGMTDWSWQPGKTKAIAQVVSSEKHGGDHALLLSNPAGKPVQLFQTVHNLQPNTLYKVSLWCKGQKVSDCWFGGGKDWKKREVISNGSYDWRELSTSIITGPDETSYDFMIISDGPTEKLIIDDIRFARE